MKISSISDVHIKKIGDSQHDLLLQFLAHEKVKESDHVMLLGDIFDLMVGGYKQYIDEYRSVFDALANLVKGGRPVHFFEGNHDFHIVGVMKEFRRQYDLQFHRFYSHRSPLLIEHGSKYSVFSHGDDIEIGNFSYKIYKSLINNFGTKFLMDYLVPYDFVRKIGARASEKSREYQKDDWHSSSYREKIRQKFRKSADIYRRKTQLELEYIVLGHSHIQDKYKSELGFTYLNNGFIPETKTFTYIDGLQSEFIQLS